MNKLRCPICGKPFVIYCLASNPPKFEGECISQCGFMLRYYKRKDSFLEITQSELEEKK
jgi:hypothetical protein